MYFIRLVLLSLARLGQHVLGRACEHRERQRAGAQRPEQRLHGRGIPEQGKGEKRRLSRPEKQ